MIFQKLYEQQIVILYLNLIGLYFDNSKIYKNI